MRTLLVNLTLSISLLAPLLTPVSATAEAEKPLMVIRFNHENVDYDSSLKRVIKSALRAKEDTKFEVVVLSGNSTASQDKAQILSEEIAEKIQGNGVSEAQITKSTHITPDNESIQAQIFVE